MIEREYTIPLRKEFLKAPRYKRAMRSIHAIQNFIAKHMKVDTVKIGRHLNHHIFQHGRQNPPSRVKIKVLKEDTIAKVELFGKTYEEFTKKEGKEKKADLKKLKGISRKEISSLKDHGFKTIEDLSKADPKDISHKLGITEEMALVYIENAKKKLEEPKESKLEEMKKKVLESVQEKKPGGVEGLKETKPTQKAKRKSIIGDTGKS